MKLVIFHYHLNRGGVSRVIENHLRALATLDSMRQPSSVVVAFGGRATDWDFQFQQELPFDLQFVPIMALEYDDLDVGNRQDCYSALNEMLDRLGCARDSTVLHAHNHSLGKNASFPIALSRLATDGWRTLLQLHDFAEDLRPRNYLHLAETAGSVEQLYQYLYPQAKHVHYAALNRRDFDLLSNAGIAADRMHALPNPVMPILAATTTESQPERKTSARQKLAATRGVPVEQPYFLYPVRGIQRKNIGELLLWASLCEHVTFAMTLPPLNPRELSSYSSWKAFASSSSLPVLFEAGEGMSLAENYAAADAVITTSVAEGFGLVFLEAALMHRPLFGRNLPGITDDFLSAGIRFPGLVDSIKIPLPCIRVDQLKQTLLQQAKRLRASYQLQPLDEDRLAREIEPLFEGETFDFAQLDVTQQRNVIRQVQEQRELREAIKALNPVTQVAASLQSPSEVAQLSEFRRCLAANVKAIEQHYSIDAIGRQLQGIYDKLLQIEPGRLECHPEIAVNLQQAFLQPRQLFPIRLEP